MSWYRTRIALGIITAIAALWAAPAAGAATAQGPHSAAPRAFPVPCTSRVVWVRLQPAIGQPRCYAGNGPAVVNLPGVRSLRVTGRHTVCLFTIPAGLHGEKAACYRGPITHRFIRPVYVRYLVIRTP
jgi:hypothetical protein